ncbi:Nucleolar GTP-binding protein 2 [Tetrabaena socialis]|uniref:Nuclear/nucleolar GTPase 2 n=1 Tax=Tetrabaena socialis TaxID=47790 RepID=A0A2J8A8H8_9CHLO|nr:Nucleolar GTP-binding protein 2 [Tetrabaena socialis]|eukprot:PNH08829.1 Nucleolar GTP-binding protein 2 [Tetrabaena socialis]
MTKSAKGGAKGGGKKRAAPKLGGVTDDRKPKHSMDGNRPSSSKGGMRTAATVRRLKMYKQRPVRDKDGKLLYEELQSKDLPTTRIMPDRRWFGNTRVIGQKQLEQFRTEMASKVNDAYTVLLREKKLPLQLLEDPEKKLAGKQLRSNLVTTQPFADTFGPKKQRKRPKLATESLEDLAVHADAISEKFEAGQAPRGPNGELVLYKEPVLERAYEKGQSKRIWGELYKVLDSSDVVVQVLDARDPNGTRCTFLEQHIRKHLRHKHIILLLNKCDLVPSWVTKRWLHFLSREFPVLAFHASITNPFGKGALLSLLRQLARLRSDKQAISVGFVGYPNVGKSSVINTLRTKKVCKAAPIPGETKVWQYITLMKRIFCIDCPGVVYNRTHDTPTDLVLKGVVRVENLEDATHHVDPVLQRVKPEYLKRAYKIKEWTDTEDFLAQLARLSGKLLKGGEPDLNTAARMVLYDWQRGKVPFFTLPPDHTDEAPPPKAGGGGRGKSAAAIAAAAAAAAAAAGAAAGDVAEPRAEDLPVPREMVTEEDAAKEAGVKPEVAAAAARAVREVLMNATAAQARAAIPVQADYFMPEDERRAGEADEAAADPDLISSDSEDDEDEEGAAGEEGPVVSEDETGDAEEAAGQLLRRGGARAVAKAAGKAEATAAAAAAAEAKKKGGKRRLDDAAAAAAGEADGNDSDGYGDEGLSWEAVLACVQGAEVPTGAPAATADDQQAKARKGKGGVRGKGNLQGGAVVVAVGKGKGPAKAPKRAVKQKLRTLD